MSEQRFGAWISPTGAQFALWATEAQQVDVRLFEGLKARRSVPLERKEGNVFALELPEVRAGELYKWVLDGVEVVDPYARFLPYGVDGPGEILAPGSGGPLIDRPPLHRLVIYELHVGTFTPEGTYAAAATRLAELADLGINTVELLPLSSFPGQRGWGYDGVAHFAPQPTYGRPEALRAFVAEAHRLGLSVLLDVVYNHFGPRGLSLPATSPAYFTDRGNLWGAAPDYTELHMRNFVLANARMWFEEYGFDGLRLDATHAILDPSGEHILHALSALAHAYPQPRLLFAEDDRNDPAVVLEQSLDGQWADDFHHQVHVLLTGEQDGYYAGYRPTLEDLARTIEQGWLYQGQIYPSWGRPRGAAARALSPEQLVYCLQNHDQVGNRARGTRLTDEAPLEAVEAATALILFLPSVPLLFMGQEWAASSPFLYFTDHDPDWGAKVSAGRRAEFAGFAAFGSGAGGEIPDPQAEATFLRSRLDWSERAAEPHRRVWQLTQALLRLRREDPVLSAPCAWSGLRAEAQATLLVVRRASSQGQRTLLVNFSARPQPTKLLKNVSPLFVRGELQDGALGPHAAVIIGH